MTRKEKVVLPWKCMFGSLSHINLFGKIVFAPIIIVLATTISICELLFSVDDK